MKTKQTKQNRKELNEFSLIMQRQPTKSEKILLDEIVRLRKGFTFQYPIYDSHHRYIVDFYFPLLSGMKGLVVEVDGGYHEDKEMVYRDGNRDDYMGLRGLAVIRVTNDQVLNDLADVMKQLMAFDIKYYRKADQVIHMNSDISKRA